MKDVTTPDELAAALGARLTLLFKHSPRCAISVDSLEEVEAHLGARREGLMSVLDVVKHRALSQELERRSGIRHESPQAILVRDGKIVWHASHFRITGAAIDRELATDAAVAAPVA
ncbi:MAG: bacillithiol system redox-active protein YtxJ [Thermoanaerobaculia bacterium]